MFTVLLSLFLLFSKSSQPAPRRSHPGGDFRVAQVAQDEVYMIYCGNHCQYIMLNIHLRTDKHAVFFNMLGNCTFYAEAGNQIKA